MARAGRRHGPPRRRLTPRRTAGKRDLDGGQAPNPRVRNSPNRDPLAAQVRLGSGGRSDGRTAACEEPRHAVSCIVVRGAGRLLAGRRARNPRRRARQNPGGSRLRSASVVRGRSGPAGYTRPRLAASASLGTVDQYAIIRAASTTANGASTRSTRAACRPTWSRPCCRPYAAATTAVVLAEEWHTARSVMSLSSLLERAGMRDRVTILWNANNTFGFDQIDWPRLKQAAPITTVSRYMKHQMRRSASTLSSCPTGFAATPSTRFRPRLVQACGVGFGIVRSSSRWRAGIPISAGSRPSKSRPP